MTSINRVFSGAVWEPQVGYCRAVKAGQHIYISGTAAVDADVLASNDGYAQAKCCFEIIQTALHQLGACSQDVVRTRMFVTDISRWPEFAQAHSEFFGEHPPATSMLEVKGLIDPAMLIEVEADAVCVDTPTNTSPAIKSCEDCSSLEELRSAIDQIDAQIIRDLGNRLKYVRAAAKFKTSAVGVKAPDRVHSMLQQRRAWATAAGLSPDVIEKLYQDLISYFINLELQHYESTQSE